MSVAEIPGLTAYRFLPFLGYLTFSRSVRWWKKGVALLLFAMLVALGIAARQDLSEILWRGPAALLYFAFVTLLAYPFRGRLGSEARRLAFIGACLVAYMLIPALFYRNALMIATVGIGWGAALSAYSYCIDASSESNPSWRSCVFFVLVNPSVVYAERGTEVSTLGRPWRGMDRIALGVCAWVLQVMIQVAILQAMRVAHPTGYPKFLVLYGGSAAALYCAYSGLASVQIGMARWVGYDVPECYDYPFLSRSPEEFWRRWNRYLGSWIKRYVFFPTALRSRRALPRALGGLSSAIAVLVSFFVIGLFHDYPLWLAKLGIGVPRATLIFVAFGVLLLVWHWLSGVLSARTGPVAPGLKRACGVVACVAFLHTAYAMVGFLQWTAMP